ncbi:MAG: peptide deformylase [Lactobacillales bacterium]|jgi:peptide deformylase|nr:peptide deformylase [Lactobacillales bacterium]
MTKLKILEIPEDVLYRKATDVTQIDDSITTLLDDMLETMYAARGIGLAGNQIGVLKRLVVIDPAGKDEAPMPIKLINPKITKKSDETIFYNEGCLSIPREYADVERHAEITVEYVDETGQKKKIQAAGILAVVLQHELDHLDGVLFIDRISPLKRKRLLKHLEKRRLKEAKESQEEGEK